MRVTVYQRMPQGKRNTIIEFMDTQFQLKGANTDQKLPIDTFKLKLVCFLKCIFCILPSLKRRRWKPYS